MRSVLSETCRHCSSRHKVILLICVAIVCFWIYREQGSSTSKFTMEQLRKDLIKPPFAENETGKHDIILSAYMNSGSRFTGRPLGFINQSFYFYEPLWKFTLWDYYTPPDVRCSTTEGSCRSVKTETENSFYPDQFHVVTEPIVPGIRRYARPIELMLHVLSSIFRCDLVPLKNVIQERVHDSPSYSGPSWEKYRICISKFRPKSECISELEQVCKSRTHRVLKVLRLSVSAFRPLLEINPRLKIVHLVRDPRAIINSRLFSRFYPVSNPKTNNSLEKNLCEKMETDIIEALKLREEFPGRILLVYYEDLLVNFPERLKQLYDKLNLTFNSEKVKSFSDILVNLSPPEKGSNFTRDRKRTNALWWRKHMPWHQVQTIDGICKNVYKILGYKVLTKQHILDTSIPSVDIPEHLKL